jgi:pantetheine-phosphate adenylyltransferase
MNFYAGSFSPPTYGHLHIVEKAMKRYDFGHLIIVCSSGNPNKENMFTEEQSREMWKVYLRKKPSLAKVRVITYKKAIQETMKISSIVLVRGLRGKDDLEQEMETVMLNKTKRGIDAFYLIFADDEYTDFSSTKARDAFFADDYDTLTKLVDQKVAYLMKIYHNKNKKGSRK